MTTALTYDDAFAGVREAVVQLLTDRGEPPEPGTITRDRALFAYSEDVLDSLELDSLDALELISLLEEQFDVQLPDDIEFDTMRTVGHVADALVAAAPGP